MIGKIRTCSSSAGLLSRALPFANSREHHDMSGTPAFLGAALRIGAMLAFCFILSGFALGTSAKPPVTSFDAPGAGSRA